MNQLSQSETRVLYEILVDASLEDLQALKFILDNFLIPRLEGATSK